MVNVNVVNIVTVVVFKLTKTEVNKKTLLTTATYHINIHTGWLDSPTHPERDSL